MNALLSFLAALLGSLLDPVLLSGGGLAGWLFRPKWAILVAAAVWNFLIYVALYLLAYHGEGHPVFLISGAQYLGSCAAAIVAAFITKVILLADRENPPSLQSRHWGAGLVVALAIALFAWAAWAKNLFYRYYDVQGRPCYWERSNFQLHYWAMDYPFPPLLALLAFGAAGAGLLLHRRRWPRARLFWLLLGLYVEFFFWAALSALDLKKFP